MLCQYLLYSFLFTIWTTLTDCHNVKLCVDLCPACFTQRTQTCPPLPDCPIRVPDPGCGCCSTCAADVGDRCGINKPRCAPGLKCTGDLSDIINNRAICKVDLTFEDTREKASRLRLLQTRHIKQRRRRKNRRFPRHPHHGLLQPLNHDGPCSRHYEELMTSCRTMAQRVWLPTCNSRGFYAPKQCMSSIGLERGKCWCVDERGVALDDTPYTTAHITCNR